MLIVQLQAGAYDDFKRLTDELHGASTWFTSGGVVLISVGSKHGQDVAARITLNAPESTFNDDFPDAIDADGASFTVV